MPSLLDIRRRIRSVKNTQQLTKAMKTVSAAKLRRAQERVLSARPYADQLKKVLGNLAGRLEEYCASASRSSAGRANPVRRRYGGPRSLRCVQFEYSADGAGFLREHATQSVTPCDGRPQGPGLFPPPWNFHSRGIRQYFFTSWTTAMRETSRNGHSELYSEAEVDAVYIVYNEFKSAIQQRVVDRKAAAA